MAGQTTVRIKIMDAALSFYYYHSICDILMPGQHRRHVILCSYMGIIGISVQYDHQIGLIVNIGQSYR